MAFANPCMYHIKINTVHNKRVGKKFAIFKVPVSQLAITINFFDHLNHK